MDRTKKRNKADYPPCWPLIAQFIKGTAGWKCENCGHPHDIEAGYMLTVHHLDGNRGNCRYQNLLACCQRCHLRIQTYYYPGQLCFDPPAWAVKRGLM